GWVSMKFEAPEVLQAAQQALQKMRSDWPGYLDGFFGAVFSEPHSTKAYEDAVLRSGGATDGETVAMGRNGWLGTDMREAVARVRCPTLVMHGDGDKIVPFVQAETIAAAVPGARLLTIGGG